MNSNHSIIIVMTMDKNYVYQTRVTIWSLLYNAKDANSYEINILCSDRLEESAKDSLKILEKQFAGLKIFFREIKSDLFMKASPQTYVPVASFYRLIIAEILPEVDQCLFLDGDMLIQSDLKELYQTDMENYYIAGVPDSRIQCNLDEYSNYCSVLDIPTMKMYVNAGVLILNLKEWRKNNLTKEFMKYIGQGFDMMDQDILNKCCFGRIKFLDLKYNFFSDYYKNGSGLMNTVFSKEEVKEAFQKFAVLHYAGMYKPWNNIRMKNAKLWWSYAQKALEQTAYEEIYGRAEEKSRERDWIYILEKCEKEKNIIIFGFSRVGKELAASLIKSGIKGIVCFCDNDRLKQHQSYMGIDVCSLEEAKSKEALDHIFWINTSQRQRESISQQLKNADVPENRIFNYYTKPKTYYRILEEEYKEYEEQQTVMREEGVRNMRNPEK